MNRGNTVTVLKWLNNFGGRVETKLLGSWTSKYKYRINPGIFDEIC